ncbi:MAG: hypothetical protein IIY81_08895 [Lachnospiraceae bacterium]|nr:hypothetical protein [Lachnospiraceae bacterium]
MAFLIYAGNKFSVQWSCFWFMGNVDGSNRGKFFGKLTGTAFLKALQIE